ncbi:peptidoglycan-binding protein [Streptomyces sp. NBC_00264]|uniref:peptidoglycan-binding protein n=1 Tax=unclassified Streptomyces TaxID=2593676 RepID=UPI000F5C0620|nr:MULTISPECIES: peptidoglycan-binding protein [unclassified Streptomyces]MCX5166307.1 peptidoglycan-binding protein [Streptomyces sp. NBC_00305]MCX5224824.1 peptidoglycan-binding protein [Streptomyces sp. NBC_00264]RPK53960.1 Zinc D-Ala-D-Ala carboxypeptidase precursor [Streptomyces sp. ADI95-17]WSW99017.1 peptidoglycan-binding protein [Streptomyces sp. NBC_00987]
MNRTPRTLWATLTTAALAIAAFATLGTQAPDTATASSSDPAASAARSADPASRNQWPTLRTGAQGSAVTTLQQLLTARGHSLTADGAFGPLTEAAVRAFQAQHSLQADGIVGPKTWNALRSTPTAPTKPSPRPGPGTYTLKLTKNWGDPLNSRLALVKDGKELKSYRAGSGLGVTNECASGAGWLPSGTYQVKGHERDHGNWISKGIRGYAIQLADKPCKPKPGQKTVMRTELFIHSEMLHTGAQNPLYIEGKDNIYRWDGNVDYESWGCIKITPTDIKDLFTRLDQAGWPKNLTLQVS